MGFNLTAFAGGFAESAAEGIAEERKTAQLRGIEATKNLYNNYNKVKSENEKTISEVKNNIRYLRNFDDTATEAELFSLAKNKPLMEQVVKRLEDKDAHVGFRVKNFYQIAENNVQGTAEELTDKAFDFARMYKEKFTETPAQQTEGFFGNIRKKGTERGMLEAADALGVSLDQLKAAKDWKQPELSDKDAKVNMTGLMGRTQEKFESRVNKAQLAVDDAIMSGDQTKIEAAQERLAAINEIKDPKKPETWEQQAKKLADKAVYGKTVEEKQKAEKELKALQLLHKPPKERDGTADAASNTLIANSINRSYNARIAAALPTGSFTTNPVTGEITISAMVKDTVKRDAVAKAQESLIRDNTRNGVPISEGHKYGLMAIGVNYDDKGKAVQNIPSPNTEMPTATQKQLDKMKHKTEVVPKGVDPEDWKYLTPEEKAKWKK